MTNGIGLRAGPLRWAVFQPSREDTIGRVASGRARSRRRRGLVSHPMRSRESSAMAISPALADSPMRRTSSVPVMKHRRSRSRCPRAPGARTMRSANRRFSGAYFWAGAPLVRRPRGGARRDFPQPPSLRIRSERGPRSADGRGLPKTVWTQRFPCAPARPNISRISGGTQGSSGACRHRVTIDKFPVRALASCRRLADAAVPENQVACSIFPDYGSASLSRQHALELQWICQPCARPAVAKGMMRKRG